MEVDHKDQMEPTKTLPDVLPDENHFKEFEEKELEIRTVDPEDARTKQWDDDPEIGTFDVEDDWMEEWYLDDWKKEWDSWMEKWYLDDWKKEWDSWMEKWYLDDWKKEWDSWMEKWYLDARMKERDFGPEIRTVDSFQWYQDPWKTSMYGPYDMREEIKDRVLIINNYHFERLHVREGSEKDVVGLVTLFTKLGFELEVRVDLTHDEMKELLARECRRDYTDYKCFFLIIMSHGNKGVVFGKDGYRKGREFYNSLNIEDIKCQFCEVESLEGKPKVFIIEACQGSDKFVPRETEADNKKDEEEIKDENTFETALHAGGDPVDADRPKALDGRNVEVDDGTVSDDKGDDEDGSEISDPNSDDGDEEEDGEDCKHDRRDETNPIIKRFPIHADVFTMKSSADGFVSYRDSVYGCWFIQAFIFVVTEYAQILDLLSLMEKVKVVLTTARTRKDKRCPRQYGQAISPAMYTFRKKYFFYFNMPLETKGGTQKASMSLKGDEKDSIYMKEMYDSLFNKSKPKFEYLSF